jgi:hypothetical protein
MRYMILILVCIVVAATAVMVTAQSQPLPANVNSRWGQFWGAYVWQTDEGSGNHLPALITFHIDGTITGSDGSMSGGLNPKIRTTSLHGVWVRTGWQSVGGTSLWLVFDSATGVVMKYGRARSSLEFTDDFRHFQGKMFVESLACDTQLTCPDPLDPSAKWAPNPAMPADGFLVTGDRLDRVPAGPLQP